jgi:hypothetical protein
MWQRSRKTLIFFSTMAEEEEDKGIIKVERQISPIFTQELSDSIAHVVGLQRFKEKNPKVCMLWTQGRLGENGPRMICFRKVLVKNKKDFQILVSNNPLDFERVIEQADDATKGWNTVVVPLDVESKLSPILSTIKIDEMKTTDNSMEWMKRIYKPHIAYWDRYSNGWSNGKHLELLGKYTDTLASGYPIEFIGKCCLKIGSLIKSSLDSL